MDLYAVLRIQRDAKGGFCGGETRVRACYHREAQRYYDRAYNGDAAALRQFRRVSLAFAVLKDKERRRLYDDHGLLGLRRSEAYQQESVFDDEEGDAHEPFGMYEAFFRGDDPNDRQYLLLNGPEAMSDDSEGDDDEEDGEADANTLAAVTANAAKESATQKRKRGPSFDPKPMPKHPSYTVLQPPAAQPATDPWTRVSSAYNAAGASSETGEPKEQEANNKSKKQKKKKKARK